MGFYIFDIDCIGTILNNIKAYFMYITKTYEEIAKEILKEYSGAVIATVGEKVPIEKPLIQYKETDREFLKRITSHFENIIYPEYKQAKSNIYMGYCVAVNALDTFLKYSKTTCKKDYT